MLKTGLTRYTFESIIGSSSSLKEVIENARRVTRTSSSVLIVGEEGTGKEIFAQSIHHASDRASEPFFSQYCAAIRQYNWPGNVRELEHIIEGSVNLVTDEVTTISSAALPFHFINKTDVNVESTLLESKDKHVQSLNRTKT